MTVPGTFKNRPPAPRQVKEWQPGLAMRLRAAGALHVEFWAVGQCSVIVAREPVGADHSYRWHVSIAHPSRYPTWDEIKTARYAIPTVAEVENMVQLLPRVDGPRRAWTNAHDNCFHLYESVTDLDLTRT